MLKPTHLRHTSAHHRLSSDPKKIVSLRMINNGRMATKFTTMARIKGTFATKLQGRVGNVVYRVRGGENIASERPAKVSNPRTVSQQTQRMVMRTVSAAYSQLKGICDHSFEGLTYGAENMAMFMRENINMLKKADGNFNAKSNAYIVANPYIVSKGSLSPIKQSKSWLYNSNDITAFGVELPFSTEEVANLATLTVAQFHAALGYNIGEQLTILVAHAIPNAGGVIIDEATQMPYNFLYARLVCLPAQSDELMFTQVSELTNTYSINANVVDTDNSLNYAEILAGMGKTSVGVGIGLRVTLTEDDVLETVSTNPPMTCLIRSAKNNDKWERSTQRMIVGEFIPSSEYTVENILPTYSPGQNEYLNNAEPNVGGGWITQ